MFTIAINLYGCKTFFFQSLFSHIRWIFSCKFAQIFNINSIFILNSNMNNAPYVLGGFMVRQDSTYFSSVRRVIGWSFSKSNTASSGSEPPKFGSNDRKMCTTLPSCLPINQNKKCYLKRNKKNDNHRQSRWNIQTWKRSDGTTQLSFFCVGHRFIVDFVFWINWRRQNRFWRDWRIW